jgi:hypothetical protein
MSLPHVSSEGGPIILADFDALQRWRGAFDSSGHYEFACQQLERGNPSPMMFGSRESVVWDFGGPGSGDIILVSDSHISIVRIWPDASWSDEHTEAVIVSSATAQFGSSIMAHLTISSDYLLALWAAEDLSECSPPNGQAGVPEALSIGDGGAYVRVLCGHYEVTACEWQTHQFDVTKLDLIRST